jgi:hypothetical protein
MWSVRPNVIQTNRFGGTYSLCLQGERISQPVKPAEADLRLSSAWRRLLRLTSRPRRWKLRDLPKRPADSKLHATITKKMILQKLSTITWMHWGVKRYVPWDMDLALCSPLKISRSFGGTYRLRVQCLRLSQESREILLAVWIVFIFPFG